MNTLTLHTAKEEVISKCDREFTVMCVTAESNGNGPLTEITMFDSRSKKEMRKTIENIYNDLGLMDTWK